MSRKILPAVALSAATLLLLTGCSSDDDTESAAPEASATADDTAAEGRALSVDELEKALITVEDVPAGYTAQGSRVDETPMAERSSDDPTCQALLDDFAAFEEQTKDAPSANTTFADENSDMFVVALESYEGDQASDGIAKMTEMYETCGTWIEFDGVGAAEFTVEPLSFPNLGDETFATSISADGESHLVVTRVGKNVSFVYNIGADLDVAETEQVARAAVEKLQKASVA